MFRPIHYLGSKLRLLDIILGAVDSICPQGGGVLDLFSGSGVVSKGLSEKHPVCSVDVQEYARVIASALLLPFRPVVGFSKIDVLETKFYKGLYKAFEPLIDFERNALCSIDENPQHIAALLEGGPLIADRARVKFSIPSLCAAIQGTQRAIAKARTECPCTIAEYYGGVYFSYAQAIVLDACLSMLEQVDPMSRNVFHAAILSTASDIVNTVGRQFAQPVTVKKRDGEFKAKILKKIGRDRVINTESVFTSWLDKYNAQEQPRYSNTVVRGAYTEAFPVPCGFNTVYADPPYTRSHYSRYYHVLETMARRDRPAITQSNIPAKFSVSKGVYRNDRFLSAFGVLSKAERAFDELFALCSVNKQNLVLSYSPYSEDARSSPRIMTVGKLLALVSHHYKKVEVMTCGRFTHSKLTTVENQLAASSEAEVLIIARA